MLDPTPGAATANTYADVTEADAFNAGRPFGTSWAALTTAQKEGALQYTALLLDSLFVWTGEATNDVTFPDQVMCWPRVGMYDRNGKPIDPSVIPLELKYAQCEYARQSASSDLAANNDAMVQGIKSVKAGSVSVDFKDFDPATTLVLSNPAYAYLSAAVPVAVRLILVPSWYETQSFLELRGGLMLQVDR